MSTLEEHTHPHDGTSGGSERLSGHGGAPAFFRRRWRSLTERRVSETHTDSRHRLAHVDYMRGLAALAVMWFHFTTANDDCPPGLLKMSGHYGYLGVDVFFVISGFVIPYAMAARGYRLRTDALRFFLARIVRLEPPYLASVMLCVALPYVAYLTPWSRGDLPDTDLRDVVLHAAYLVPWVNGAGWLNAAYWTLAIEFQFYIIMLFIAPALIGGSQSSARLLLLGTLAAALLLGGDLRLVFAYLPLFAFGFLTFLWLERHLHGIEIALWAAVFAGACSWTVGIDDMLSGLLAAALILAPWPRGIRLLTIAGSLSYSLYLIHNPIGGRVFTIVERLPAWPIFQVAGIAMAVMVSLIAAYAFHALAEMPSLRAARRINALQAGSPKGSTRAA
jgi:peptidoglycan/LPS O-acetylase OafA/YrhL